MNSRILCAAAALLFGHAAFAGMLSVSLNDPAVSGTPGATLEWIAGVSDPTDLAAGDFILITGSSFDVPCMGCAGPPASQGTYTDLIGASFLVLAPAGNCCDDPQSMTDVPAGTFAIGPHASFGPISGFLEIDYAIYSVDPNDPNFDPTLDTVSPDVQSFSAATLDIVTPEPGSMLPALAGLLGAAAWLRLRKNAARAE